MSTDFGNESPVLDDVAQAEVEQPVQKKKGGRTKQRNNAHGIPQAVIDRLGFATPEHETAHERKIRLQGIRCYWAIRWYKYKRVPEEKWVVQFAFNPPFQYCMPMATKYNPENRYLYFPALPKKPHPTCLKTPEDYPDEQKRLAILAEKLQKKKEKRSS